MLRRAFKIFAGFLLVVLLAAGCTPDPHEAFYGKWSGENEMGTLLWEFKPDGKFLLSGSAYGDVTFEATYEFEGEDTFSVTIPDLNYEGSAEYKVEGDQLTVSSEGETVVFQRVK